MNKKYMMVMALALGGVTSMVAATVGMPIEEQRKECTDCLAVIGDPASSEGHEAAWNSLVSGVVGVGGDHRDLRRAVISQLGELAQSCADEWSDRDDAPLMRAVEVVQNYYEVDPRLAGVAVAVLIQIAEVVADLAEEDAEGEDYESTVMAVASALESTGSSGPTMSQSYEALKVLKAGVVNESLCDYIDARARSINPYHGMCGYDSDAATESDPESTSGSWDGFAGL